ncbi:MAG: flagellar protein FlgN [Betaproteobacteria bacterium]|nr:flagellar protein FlgN [Betaproteobacteria bacterium]
MLAEGFGQLNHFIRLLERERELLNNLDVEALLSLAKEKTTVIHQLQNSENTRALTLARHGIDPSPRGISAFIETQPETTQALWQRYLDLAKQAQELNNSNGQLIQHNLHHNQLALNVLMAVAGPSLYDSEGHTSSRPGGRSFGTV